MNTKWQVNPEVLSSKIDEEVILMSIEADSYFGLEPVGSLVWEMLAKQPASVSELVVQLMEEYDVQEDTCREDVLQFINDMSEKKLIHQFVGA